MYHVSSDGAVVCTLDVPLTNRASVERKGMKFETMHGQTYDRTNSLASIYFQAVARSQVTFAFSRNSISGGRFYLNFIRRYAL